MAVDGSANVYVADSNNSVIRKITPTGGVSTLAGIAYTRDHGPVIFAIFNTKGPVSTYRKLQDEFLKGFIVESGGIPQVNASLHRLNN